MNLMTAPTSNLRRVSRDRFESPTHSIRAIRQTLSGRPTFRPTGWYVLDRRTGAMTEHRSLADARRQALR